jgi:hypothetical protein
VTFSVGDTLDILTPATVDAGAPAATFAVSVQ